ncbi:MAG: 50S ribosomal protein L13 [bacterium]
MAKEKVQIKAKKYIIDATDQAVGRLATQISMILMGKNLPNYVPNIDNTNKVIITNYDKLRFTGKKLEQKEYFRHSGYPGGLKRKLSKDVLANSPEKLILLAIKRMLPNNKLRAPRLNRISFK